MEFKLNNYHRNIPDEELLEDIKRVARKLGKDSLTTAEYTKGGGIFHWSTIINRFGGWLKALELSSLKVTPAQHTCSLGRNNHGYIDDDQLIIDLRRVSAIFKSKTISSGDYKKHGYYSKETYSNRFGSWNNALIAAGLVPFDVVSGKRISENELIDEIGRMWIELGRQPTTTDIKNGLSKYSLHAFERRFGSWRKALEFFVDYMNGEKDIETPAQTEDKPEIKPVRKPNTPKTGIVHSTKRDISLRMRFLVMKRDDFKCCMCGRSPATNPGLELHIDHIKPWSKGGETVFDNLQTLCSDCNLGKSNLT